MVKLKFKSPRDYWNFVKQKQLAENKMEEFFKIMHDDGRIKEIHLNGEKVENVTSATFRWSVNDPKMVATIEVINKTTGDKTLLTTSGWSGKAKQEITG